ncbi:UDP-N-acetyl-D-glucosamine 2-epimerase, UDP-hydrolysing [Clostridium sp. KLE 1755]|uniref:UDP-N-acetylglucosamine 2-epimerase n=1 Tax=Clostridia TaxID=186801 RepID=UPI000396F781|nr:MULTISPECIES: UDP-N-acetylglucosamine 2-epimerase [Clostridia]ERI68237.1 UDP-N-acetyl-D-glucosamine 2-epimerase, UDP-hydrolysing [Clostridium sp. KLE 1755]MDU5289763.1 UDP-N-acetylglucosamine 2-epimerase [Clostridium sp.]
MIDNIRKKKIAVVTATRAEYGVLRRILKILNEDDNIQMLLYVTGTHLSKEYGYTVEEIQNDLIPIRRMVDINVRCGGAVEVAETISTAQVKFVKAFLEDLPDILLVVGDRYELLPICTSALLLRIPIAHISGGEVTEGAIDDIIRNCITKMSYLHFPACAEYKNRIIQMGEDPERVFDFGDIGVDSLLNTERLTKTQLEESMLIKLDRPFSLVTFHPVTMQQDSLEQLTELLLAIEQKKEYLYIITKANADMGGEDINKRLEEFCKTHDHCILFSSLGNQRYISLLALCDFVMGNSSSGIYEAPAFRKPVVNIGDRQKGRVKAECVVDCLPKRKDIIAAIEKTEDNAFRNSIKNMQMPFTGGATAENIIDTIKDFLNNNRISLMKGFYDINFLSEKDIL